MTNAQTGHAFSRIELFSTAHRRSTFDSLLPFISDGVKARTHTTTEETTIRAYLCLRRAS